MSGDKIGIIIFVGIVTLILCLAPRIFDIVEKYFKQKQQNEHEYKMKLLEKK